MFRKAAPSQPVTVGPAERVTSVLGPGIIWKGNLRGSGGVRIEGAFEGDITVRGLIVIGETGRVTCENLKANNVIVAGTVNGCITAEKLDIRSTGRVWGDVVAVALATEEGAFLRGQVRMEDKVEIGGVTPVGEAPADEMAPGSAAPGDEISAHEISAGEAANGEQTHPEDRRSAGNPSTDPTRPVRTSD